MTENKASDELIPCRACGTMNPPVAIFCSNCNRPTTPPRPEPQTTEERIEAHLASIRSMMAFFVVLTVIGVGIALVLIVAANQS